MSSFINLISFAFYIHKLPLIRQIRAGAVSQLEEYLPGMQKALQNHGVVMHTYISALGTFTQKAQNVKGRTKKIVQGLRVFVALPEDPASLPSTHMRDHNHS